MRIGIIGPSKIDYVEEVNKDSLEIIRELARKVAESGEEIIGVPDKGSISEFFMQEYLKNKGRNVFSMIPLDDKEFGYDWVNTEIGEQINCNTWRNQPEKLNEESDVLLCLGYSVGGLTEIAYSKWFKPKPIYIIKELVKSELPKDSVRDLDLRYISYKDIKRVLE